MTTLLPYSGRLHPISASLGLPVEMRLLSDYPDLLQAQWDLGQEFAIVEHDVIPWPGALMSLDVCPRPWCGFSYEVGIHHRVPTFGCVKFGAELIRATPGAFDPENWALERFPRDWRYCDQQLALVANAAGFEWHQHYPAVFHARGLL